LKDKYRKISNIISTLDFDKLLRGFKTYQFAFFTDDKAIVADQVIDKPNSFVANSAAEFEGEMIATYIYDFIPDNDEIAVSKVVHEMLHAHQFSNPNFFDSLVGHDEKNGMLYEYSTQSVTMKYEEVKHLINAYTTKKKEEFDLFLSIRAHREKLFPKELHYEKVTETIEGMATFVELKALIQLNDELYVEKINELIAELEDKRNYFSVRELSYSVGALIIIVMEELGVNFNKALTGEGLLSDLCEFEKQEVNIKSYNEIKSLVKETDYLNKEKVDAFLKQNPKEVPFDNILGYNPMGATHFENKVLIKYLLIIEHNDQKQTLNGDFCLIIDSDDQWKTIYMNS